MSDIHITANIALLVWPLVIFFLFQRKDISLAISLSLLGGHLLLPPRVAYNLPLLPKLDKDAISAFVVVLALMLVRSRYAARIGQDIRPGVLPKSVVVRILLVLLCLSPIMTSLTNGDSLTYGKTSLPALSLKDAYADLGNLFVMVLPFLIGWKFLGTPQAQIKLAWVVVGGLAAYAILAVYEIRFSPQLSNIVYGFFPHSFYQHFRGGSWRPIVFLEHGLKLAILIAFAIILAGGLYRQMTASLKRRAGALLVFLLIVLTLSSNLGALLLILIFLPVCLFVSPRMMILISALAATLLITYPVLRMNGLVPTHTVVSLAQSVNPARAASLETRLRNEDRFLEKANERRMFGWGGWGRARVYTETGRDISTGDGVWVLIYVYGGILRYVAIIGLLAWPLLSVAMMRKRKMPLSYVTASLPLAVAVNLIDAIPNSGINVVTWLSLGSLVGWREYLRTKGPDPVDETTDSPAPEAAKTGYTRFPGPPGDSTRRAAAQVSRR